MKAIRLDLKIHFFKLVIIIASTRVIEEEESNSEQPKKISLFDEQQLSKSNQNTYVEIEQRPST